MTVHNFKKSLERSNSYSDAPWWLEVYHKAFPNLKACVSVKSDGWAQRGGIDRVLTLASGRTITVDEKVREKDWPDIALERWSDDGTRGGRKSPGWIQKPLACDFIAYAFVPSQRCYLLPTETLQRAWRKNGRDWCVKYPPVAADNVTYVTLSTPVPIDVLFEAIKDAMLVTWDGGTA